MALVKNATIEQLILSARELDLDKRNILYKVPDVRNFNPEEFSIEIDGETFHMDDQGLKHFLKAIKVPYQYFKLCTPELREKEVREGLALNASNNTEFKFKIKGNKIYGIVAKVYPDINFETMVSKMVQNFPQGMGLTEFDLTLHKADIRFLDTTKEFIDADVLKGMVDISFSEIGDPFQIETGLFRQVCTNGAKIKFNMAPSFRMPMARWKEEVFQTAMRAIPDNMFACVKPFAETFEALKGISLPGLGMNQEDTPEEITKVLKLALPNPALQRDYKQVIFQHYNDDANFSVNGVLNAVTRTARDIDSAPTRLNLETSVGSFLANVVKASRETQATSPFTMDLPSLERALKKKN
jgi:hypothetical protein